MGKWLVWFGFGILLFLVGIGVMLVPEGSTVVVEVLIGWMFLVGGIVQLFMVFQQKSNGSRFWLVISSLASIAIGVSLLANPLAGLLALTFLIGLVFLFSGISKAIFSFSLKDRGPFWGMLLSGVISAILGVLILAEFPESAAIMLGVLLGAELISNGIFAMSYGLNLRSSKSSD